MDEDRQCQRAVPADHHHIGPIYQIRLEGHLDERWSAWLDGVVVSHEQDGTTLLCGALIDQAALFGVLIKIRDLDLLLLSVQRVEHSQHAQER
jgi:hypothetical protein